MGRVVRTTMLVALAAVFLALCGRLAAMRGPDTDFFPRWYGLRHLLLDGRDPYSSAVTREIAARTWFLAARPADSGGPSSIAALAAPETTAASGAPTADEIAYGFLYPLPGALLLAPLALLPYHAALAVWTAAGVVLLVATGWLVADAAVTAFTPGPSPRRGSGEGGQERRLLASLMALVFLPGWVNLVLGQPATLVTFLVALALWLDGRRGSANGAAGGGAALAAATLLKPHLLVIAAPLWLAGRATAWWGGDRRARAFVLGAIGAALGLTGAATVLVPAWPVEWLAAARAYAVVAPGAPIVLGVAAAVLPPWPAAAAAALAGAALLAAVVRARRGPTVDLLSLAVAATALLVPPAWITNAVALLIPLAATCARLRPRPAALFATASAALSVALLPVFLTNDPRSGTLAVLAYSALLVCAHRPPFRLRSAPAAGAAAPSLPH